MSSNEESEDDPFVLLKKFLAASGTLDESDATIYALGLKKGTITSSDAAEATGLRQTTSGGRLKRLASKGFFEVTPHVGETPASGRGYPRKYRVVHPRIVLKDLFDMFETLLPKMDIIDQHLEVQAESTSEEGNLWLLRPQRVALRRGSVMLRGAERSIKIYGHDCTWCNGKNIMNALKDAAAKGILVQVLATNPDKKVTKVLMSIKAELYVLDFPGIPFCLVDDSILIMPRKEGTLQTQYSLIFTNDKYMVEHFGKLYVKLLSCSKPWEG